MIIVMKPDAGNDNLNAVVDRVRELGLSPHLIDGEERTIVGVVGLPLPPTLDEMFELLTLDQTGKLAKKITVVLYGSQYWNGVIDMQFLAEKGAISPKDIELFQFADTPEEAFRLLTDGLTRHHLTEKPDAEVSEVPSEPAASAQEQLGPDIAKTRP